ncbi:CLUMA_CG019403, isoform A [Clunio marinus]|uniref:CLUMA_CG019403, isoform A n=1 Tax=Clunio marinus TaxID=568069 RepID=A0A1J1J2G3_9DIPT|nr:CLUMA_CG019403, isoform A [Clunio marinus]
MRKNKVKEEIRHGMKVIRKEKMDFHCKCYLWRVKDRDYSKRIKMDNVDCDGHLGARIFI